MERVSFLMRVRDGMQEEYIRRHRAVWPEVLAEMQRAGIANMSIFMQGTDLVLYMEVENYEQAVRILNDSPASLRWEEYMSQIMEENAGKSYDPANAYPESLPEVFHWESTGQPRSVRHLHVDEANGASLAALHYVPARKQPVRP